MVAGQVHLSECKRVHGAMEGNGGEVCGGGKHGREDQKGKSVNVEPAKDSKGNTDHNEHMTKP